jgi:hypothetical protein
MDILNLFGEATGLKTNLQKSNILPIRCEDRDIVSVQTMLPCALADFPCKYLGLPLSLKRLTKAQVQPYIDRIADQLQGWKANLMTKAGRKVQVQFVLTGMLIYLLMAVEFPAWAIKAIDKIRRGFLWRGRKDALGGHCLITWPKVCRPKEHGGLGISDLKTLGWSLKMRWVCLQKTDPDRPWADFNISIPEQIQAFFPVAVYFEVGVELLLCFGLIVGSMVRALQILRPISWKLSQLENEGNEWCKRPLSIMLGSLIFKEVFL